VPALAYGEPTHSSFPSAKVQLIAESGHFPWVEQPAAFWPVIDDFLAGFPGVTRQQVIEFLEQAKDRLVESVP